MRHVVVRESFCAATTRTSLRDGNPNSLKGVRAVRVFVLCAVLQYTGTGMKCGLRCLMRVLSFQRAESTVVYRPKPSSLLLSSTGILVITDVRGNKSLDAPGPKQFT